MSRHWNLTCDRCCQVWVTRMVCTHVTQALVKSECRFCCLSSVCVCVSVYNKPSCYCLRPMNNSFLNATLATIYSMCVCCPPIHPSIRPSIHPSTYRSTYLSIYLYSCHYKLSVSMNIYMNIHACIVLVYIYISIYIYMNIHASHSVARERLVYLFHLGVQIVNSHPLR